MSAWEEREPVKGYACRICGRWHLAERDCTWKRWDR